jgi:hypothetical protein
MRRSRGGFALVTVRLAFAQKALLCSPISDLSEFGRNRSAGSTRRQNCQRRLITIR